MDSSSSNHQRQRAYLSQTPLASSGGRAAGADPRAAASAGALRARTQQLLRVDMLAHKLNAYKKVPLSASLSASAAKSIMATAKAVGPALRADEEAPTPLSQPKHKEIGAAPLADKEPAMLSQTLHAEEAKHKKELDDRDQHIFELQEQLADTEGKLKRSMAKAAAVEGLQAQVHSLTDALNCKVAEDAIECKASADDVSALQVQLSQLREALAATQRRALEDETRVRELTAQADDNKQFITQQRAENERVAAELDAGTAREQSLRADAEATRSESCQLRADLDAARADALQLRVDIGAARAASHQLHADVDAREVELGEAGVELEAARVEARDLRRELDSCTAERDELKAEASALRERADAAASRAAELQSALETEKEETARHVREFEEISEQHHIDIAGVAGECEELRRLCSEQQLMLKQLERQSVDGDEALATSGGDEERMRVQVTAQGELARLRQEVSLATKRAERAERQWATEREEWEEAVLAERDLRTGAEQRESLFREALKDSRAQVTALGCRLEEARGTCADACTERRQLRGDVSALRRAKDVACAKLRELEFFLGHAGEPQPRKSVPYAGAEPTSDAGEEASTTRKRPASQGVADKQPQVKKTKW
eukprot:TRINITY_DN4701_c0_g1_i1.p1 TRINITY_DN4701_c0_g1~~TRINITY_DN4701_c0_g1_i1.p1  ORF type:complete len:614 (+),score=169.28 TRINITY_DN4701_c0_g1_i1:22-1863(+)